MTLLPMAIAFALNYANAETNERAQRIKKEQEVIPKGSVAPPKLGSDRKSTSTLFQCPRPYIYREKTYNCDSFLGWDGENLRHVIKDVPDAVADLDTYQSNREKIQELRYVGGAGLLLLVGGYILSKSLDEGNSYDRKGLIFGGGLAVLGFGSGLILNSRNEKNIESAIQKYNQSRPNDPIQFEITTGAGF